MFYEVDQKFFTLLAVNKSLPLILKKNDVYMNLIEQKYINIKYLK